MGKAEVVAALGGGRYLVRPVYERAAVDRRIRALQNRIGQIDLALQNLDAALAQWIAIQAQRSQELMALIGAQAAPDEIERAEKALAYAQEQVIRVGSEKAHLELERAACERKIATLQAALPPASPPAVEGLSIDGTTGLTGEVGTIEVDLTDEDQAALPHVLLRPGHGGAAAWSGSRDGVLKPPAACLPEEAYYAYALLPGVARYRPRYRLGTVESVDTTAQTLTVDVEGLRLTHQDLECRHAARVTATAEYRGSTSVDLFEPGDRVVLEARPPAGAETWPDGPWVVIGFAESPKVLGTGPLAISGPEVFYHGAQYAVTGGSGSYYWEIPSAADIHHSAPWSIWPKPLLSIQSIYPAAMIDRGGGVFEADWPQDASNHWYMTLTVVDAVTGDRGELQVTLPVPSAPAQTARYTGASPPDFGASAFLGVQYTLDRLYILQLVGDHGTRRVTKQAVTVSPGFEGAGYETVEYALDYTLSDQAVAAAKAGDFATAKALIQESIDRSMIYIG